MAVSFDLPRRSSRSASTRHRPSRPPRRVILDVALALAGIGLGVVVGMAVIAETGSELTAPGGLAIFLGSLTGLVGTYLALLMVLLVSRIPPVERILGQDGLLRWHRRLAPWPLSLLTLHAVTITLGYAEAAKTGIWAQFAALMGGYADVLAATVGLGLMLLAGFTSVRAIRSRMSRETWWIVHLYLYMALALSFAHVIVLGPSFVGHPLTRVLWSAVWVATAGTVLAYRVGLPVLRSLRHRLEVVEVRPEAPGVVSVICTGRNLDRLAVSGGQFFQWRFLARGLWWQAHPYTLSALPRPPFIRLTVKGLGDHSQAMARLTPGTRIAIEGPYGAFTSHARHRSRAVLVAAGIGVTALRALLEDLPTSAKPIVILRASNTDELPLRGEIAELVDARHGELHEMIGSRREHRLDAKSLRKVVPDLTRRDVFVCGPEAFVADIVGVLARMGLPREAVHHEAFAL